MDQLIEQKAAMSINKLTKGGTSWQKFRQLEHITLKELLGYEKLVVGVGGGAPVNNIIKDGIKKTFGEINAELFQQNPQALIILLTANDKVIHDRLYKDEMDKPDIKRPILNPARALLVQKKLLEHMKNPVKQKEIIVEEIIKDSLKMLEKRKPLYAALTDKVVDTSESSPKEAVENILKYLTPEVQ